MVRSAKMDSVFSVLSAERALQVAPWARQLSNEELDRARAGMSEKAVKKGATICHRGDKFDYWSGVISGFIKCSSVTSSGDQVTIAAIPAGAWFGEGSVIKDEPRRYDIVALRDSTLALLDRPTFMWLMDNSNRFLRHLVTHLNERVSLYIAALENDRSFEPTTRIARCISWLFNPILFPGGDRTLEISQEEVGLISGVSRPLANKGLKSLENKGLISIQHNSITVLDLASLHKILR